ncbi:YciI family protein [Streptomyces sp. NBC_01450]|uniref:YciI family protein n=1 Tax=Streptomyces sp. NBC_01450 TaxID=2903871 RepID=UPI002E37D3A6|nr:YciI family protein [Streptomyces sp. NBC_01450]
MTGTVTAEREQLVPHAEEEARVLRRLKADGVVLCSFRRTDKPGAFLIVEADSLDSARERLDQLPYVANGLLTFEFIEVDRL